MSRKDSRNEVRAKLEGDLAAKRARQPELTREIERLTALADAAPSYAASRPIAEQLWKAQRDLRNLGREIAALDETLETDVLNAIGTQVDNLCAAVVRHEARIIEAVSANLDQMQRAAETNRSVLDAIKDARAEFGDELVTKLLPGVVSISDQPLGLYNGTVREDLVRAFTIETGRRLAVLAAKPSELTQKRCVAFVLSRLPATPPESTTVSTASPQRTPAPALPSRRLISVSSRLPRSDEFVTDDSAIPHAAPEANASGPIPAGHVRARTVRPGFPHPLTERVCQRGCVIDMPAAAFAEAVRNGAVEPVEQAA